MRRIGIRYWEENLGNNYILFINIINKMGSNNSNTYKMQNNDIVSLSNDMSNMNVEVEIQSWIREMPIQHLQMTIREIASMNNYTDNYPGMLDHMEVVTEDNRHIYEYNFAVFLTNMERKRNSMHDVIMRMNMNELRKFCRDNGITNYSGLNKKELQRHVLKHL